MKTQEKTNAKKYINKADIMANLLAYADFTKKPTRKDFIKTIAICCDNILEPQDRIYNGLALTKSQDFYNLGCIVEILIKKILGADLSFNNKKVETILDKEKTPCKLDKNGKPCRYDKEHAVYKQVEKNCNSYVHTPELVYDLKVNGHKIEVKFSTSDALATQLHNSDIVHRVIVVSLTKTFKGVFVIPPHEVRTNSQHKVEWNQSTKYLSPSLTKAFFGLGGC